MTLPICKHCKSPHLAREGKTPTGWMAWCKTCRKYSTVTIPPRLRSAVPKNLFRLDCDCRPETAEEKAEELFAVAACAQIPAKTMVELIEVSESERTRLDFLVYHGIVPELALQNYLDFRCAVLAHFLRLVELEGNAEVAGNARAINRDAVYVN
jgi:hypothetical protein